MSYAAWSVVFGEQPSAAKWNILGTNDSSFNDGTGINAAVITAAKQSHGKIYRRQGGTTGDASWASTGTSNTDTSAKEVFYQAGSLAVNANPTTLTFPVAFNQAPIVLAAVSSASGANAFVNQPSAPTTTTASFRTVNDGGTVVTSETISWVAIGQ